MSVSERTDYPEPDAAAVRAPAQLDTFMGMRITPLTQRRIDTFKKNRRGVWSLWIFGVMFVVSLFAEILANDRPLIISFDGDIMFPFLVDYPETRYGGFFETPAEYRDPYVADLIEEKGWILWPLVPFSFDTINYNLDVPVPSPPSSGNWVGTDDQGRDVVARLLYGFRISVLFGLTLTIISSIVGVMAGAITGEFLGGGKGFGALIRQSASQLDTPRVFALILYLSLLGLALYFTVVWMQRYFVFWNKSDKPGGVA